MAYLDDTGLAYFWGKIKAWANSVFALLGHTHPASDVTLMTGYSKPASGSAIATSDTLNQAVGKLEAKADAALDDSGYVHKTGNELVDGMKFFTYDSLFAQSLSLEKGVVPQTDDYLAFLFLDKNASFSNVSHPYRLGAINVHVYPDGGISTALMVYKNESGSSVNTYLTVGYDADGIAYGRAPSTSTTRTEGTDIVTRNFIPLDTRIVHTTGDETVAGAKTFTSKILNTSGNWKAFDHQKSSIDTTVRPSSAAWSGIIALSDKNGVEVGGASHYVDNNISALLIRCYTFGYPAADLVSAAIQLTINNGTKAKFFHPQSSADVSLGESSKRWKEVWAANGTIQTSDERLKADIGNIPDEVLDAWAEVEFLQFKFNDAVKKKGDAARLHGGVIAQRIAEVFGRHGVAADRYGFFCYDEWDAMPESRNEDGAVVQPELPAGNQYSIRYDEALCMEAAYMRRENSRLKERLAALEERLAALEMK